MRRRGFSILELVLGFAILILAVVVFFSVFSNSSQQAVQSRNRSVALIMAHSLMDEMEAHPYGSAWPKRWKATTETPVKVWVEGNPQEMIFHKAIAFTNGSFVGDVAGDTDEATITISWREGIGVAEPGVVDPNDNKVIKVRMPLWR